MLKSHQLYKSLEHTPTSDILVLDPDYKLKIHNQWNSLEIQVSFHSQVLFKSLALLANGADHSEGPNKFQSLVVFHADISAVLSTIWWKWSHSVGWRYISNTTLGDFLEDIQGHKHWKSATRLPLAHLLLYLKDLKE
jgi:hypothetical protein